MLMEQAKYSKDTEVKSTGRQECGYCGSILQFRQCLAFGKICVGCRKINYSEGICVQRQGRLTNAKPRGRAVNKVLQAEGMCCSNSGKLMSRKQKRNAIQSKI